MYVCIAHTSKQSLLSVAFSQAHSMCFKYSQGCAIITANCSVEFGSEPAQLADNLQSVNQGYALLHAVCSTQQAVNAATSSCSIPEHAFSEATSLHYKIAVLHTTHQTTHASANHFTQCSVPGTQLSSIASIFGVKYPPAVVTAAAAAPKTLPLKHPALHQS
jgi:hypothetical protein